MTELTPDDGITVSYDQLTAVRKSDGLRLTASPCDPGPGRRCVGCAVPSVENGGRPSCYSDENDSRCCVKRTRKDNRNIIWVKEE